MLEGEVRALAGRLRVEGEAQRSLARALRQGGGRVSVTEVDESGAVVVDDPLFSRVEVGVRHATVAGVDGGLVTKECHGIDIIMTRAVGVVFRYEGGRVAGCEYVPSPAAAPRVSVVTEPLSDAELASRASIERQSAEVGCALALVRAHAPALLLMDGSVVPHPSSVPPRGSSLDGAYKGLVASWVGLYEACERSGTALAGVVEDSRSSRFARSLAESVLPRLGAPAGPDAAAVLSRCRDTPLLSHLLEAGERTFVFPCAPRAAEGGALEGLGAWAGRVRSFYLRTAALDRPVRVDFVAGPGAGGRADAIAATVAAISGHHELYGIPTVLIEADGRARLAQEDAELVRSLVADLVGAGDDSLRLRREGRPF